MDEFVNFARTYNQVGVAGMSKDYVEERAGGYFVTGTRVSLDSIVYAFLRGESPEGIVESFPALTLEQILGSLAFYLANRSKVDQYLRDGKEEFDELRREARAKNPSFYARLIDARQRANQLDPDVPLRAVRVVAHDAG